MTRFRLSQLALAGSVVGLIFGSTLVCALALGLLPASKTTLAATVVAVALTLASFLGYVHGLRKRIQRLRDRAQQVSYLGEPPRAETAPSRSSGEPWEVEISNAFDQLTEEIIRLRRENAELEEGLQQRTSERDEARKSLAELSLKRIQDDREHAEKERLYRALLDTLPIGVILQDAAGNILDANRAFSELTGFSRDELAGRLAAELFEPPVRSEAGSKIRDTSPDDSVVREVSLRNRDGRTRFVEIRERGITLPEGRRRIIVTAMDISARKQHEELLRESELRYHTLFNTMITGFALHEIICDEQGRPVDYRFIDVNPAFTAMTGLRRDEVLGRRVREIFPDIEPVWIERYGKVALTGRPIAFEEYSADLQKYFSVIAFSPRRGQFAVNFIDVTEQRRAMDIVRLQGAALESSANAIMIVDREGVITWVNSAFTTLTGYSREEVLGKSPNILKSGRHPPNFYKQLWDTILSGQLWRGEVINRRKDGSLYLEELIITPVLDAQGRPSHFVAIKQDITERRSLQQRLMEAQKMETIGRLAGGIAHDFNNILQAITGFSHLLLESMDPRDPLRADVIEIDKAARRAAELTRQLLAFGRRQMLEPRAVDINALVEGTRKMLQRLIGEDIELEVRLEPNLDPVRVDPGQIEQVLVNLTLNARDAMPSGGRLTISTVGIVLLKEDALMMPEKRHGRFVVLDVTDTGVGMTPEVRERIFEPFFTTKGPGRGTGLGLSVVYGIIQQHEGMIHVYSEPGQGTTFRIYLPVCGDGSAVETSALEDRQRLTALPRGRNEKILVVEDEAGIREFVSNALQQYGYQPILAGRADEAEKLFDENDGSLSLLFTDVVLPDRTGLELAESLRRKKSELRVLLTSGYTDDKSRWPLIRERGYPFLQKPYPLQTLLHTIRQTLDLPPPPA